jgi:FMN reductase [NAD(P)H]
VDFADVLKQRRSVRAYDGRPVPHDALGRITNAAVVRAPSAGFSQGLRLVVVTDPATRKEIAIAASEEELAAKGGPRWKADAPCTSSSSRAKPITTSAISNLTS